jgi:hypothetical protein
VFAVVTCEAVVRESVAGLHRGIGLEPAKSVTNCLQDRMNNTCTTKTPCEQKHHVTRKEAKIATQACMPLWHCSFLEVADRMGD